MNTETFLPRSESKLFLACVLACYSFALGRLVLSVAHIFTPFHQPHGVFAGRGLWAEAAEYIVLTPIVATVVLVATIELLRLLRIPVSGQIFLGAAVSCAINAVFWRPWGPVVAPLFLLSSYAYLRWRRESWRVALAYTVLIHVLASLPPSIYSLAGTARSA